MKDERVEVYGLADQPGTQCLSLDRKDARINVSPVRRLF